MDADSRDWGRANPVDYVPVAGLVYRSYWCIVARRGQRHADGSVEDWRSAARSERGRVFVASGFTMALVVFVALGGVDGRVESALVPALLVALASVFVHRVLSLAGVF